MAKSPELLKLLKLLPPGMAKWASVLVLVLGYGAYDRWGGEAQQDEAGPSAPVQRDQDPALPPTPSKDAKTKPEAKAKAGSATVRLMDWNLENFSGRSLRQAPDRPPSPRGRHQEGPPVRGHDLSAIRSLLHTHKPDLVVFQEVLEPKTLDDLFRDYKWRWTRHGGRGKQFIAFGQRKESPVNCQAMPDIEKLSAGRSVRPGLRARCSHPDRPTFELIAVHLKAGTKGHDLREEQWSTIFKTLRKSRTPTVVVGDLNFAGAMDDEGPKDDRAERKVFSKRARASVNLLESKLSVPCTAYWQGEDKRDGLLESSVLDGVWLRGFGQDPAPKSQVLGACAQKRCKRIPGGRGRKAAAMAGLSDHCPLLVDF